MLVLAILGAVLGFTIGIIVTGDVLGGLIGSPLGAVVLISSWIRYRTMKDFFSRPDDTGKSRDDGDDGG